MIQIPAVEEKLDEIREKHGLLSEFNALHRLIEVMKLNDTQLSTVADFRSRHFDDWYSWRLSVIRHHLKDSVSSEDDLLRDIIDLINIAEKRT